MIIIIEIISNLNIFLFINLFSFNHWCGFSFLISSSKALEVQGR